MGVFPAWRFVSALWSRLCVAGRAGAALASPADLPQPAGEHVETGKSQTGGLGEDGLHRG